MAEQAGDAPTAPHAETERPEGAPPVSTGDVGARTATGAPPATGARVAAGDVDGAAAGDAAGEVDGAAAPVVGSPTLLEAAFRGSPAFLHVLRGPTFVFEAVNDAYRQLVGDRPLIGRPAFEALPEAANDGFQARLAHVLATRTPFVGRELPVWLQRRPDAPPEQRFVDLTYLPLVEPDGAGGTRCDRVLGHGVDVTEAVLARRAAEASLRASEVRTAALLAALPGAAVFVVDPDLRYRVAEGEALASAGLTRADFVGRTLAEAVGPALAAAYEPHYRAALAGVPFEWEHAVAGRTYLSRGVPLREAARAPASDMARDATDRTHDETRDATTAGTDPVPDGVRDAADVTGVTGVTGVLVVSVDVTAHREAERALARSLDVAEYARAEADDARRSAEDARRAAEAASRAKDDFLATMSHEFRTPLNAIAGYADLLDLGVAGPVTPQQRDYLTRLAASGRHMLGLVNDVLDLAKLDAHRVGVVDEPVDVPSVVDAALGVVQPLAAAKRVHLRAAGGARVPPAATDAPFRGRLVARGDEHRVRQVLVNLLSNAIKFTNARGAVTVRAAREEAPDASARLSARGPWLAVQVLDTGIGIAPERQGAIFEPFVQADAGHTRTYGGTGLGLTISRRLARLMGGDLTVASAPGGGSTFTLWLPMWHATVGGADAPPGRGRHAGPRDTRDGAADDRPTARVGADDAWRAPRSAGTVSSSDADSDTGTGSGRGAPGRREFAREVGGPSAAHALGAVADRLRPALDGVVERLVGRLRTDPVTAPVAAMRGRLDLEDHALSFLADVVQTLATLGEAAGGPTPDPAGRAAGGSSVGPVGGTAGGMADGRVGGAGAPGAGVAPDPSLPPAGPPETAGDLLRDGEDVRRLLGERHGRQRFRLGFSAAQLAREYALLAEELVQVVDDQRPTGHGDVSAARAALRRLLEQAAADAARGHARAALETTGPHRVIEG